MGQGLAEPGLPPHEAAGPLLWKSHKDIEQLTQQILKGRLGRGPVGWTSCRSLVMLLGEALEPARTVVLRDSLQGQEIRGQALRGSVCVLASSPLISLDILIP